MSLPLVKITRVACARLRLASNIMMSLGRGDRLLDSLPLRLEYLPVDYNRRQRCTAAVLKVVRFAVLLGVGNHFGAGSMARMHTMYSQSNVASSTPVDAHSYPTLQLSDGNLRRVRLLRALQARVGVPDSGRGLRAGTLACGFDQPNSLIILPSIRPQASLHALI